MDKSVLMQYSEMKEEIKDLRRRIRKLEKEIKEIEQGKMVGDTVKGGMGGTQHFLVKGVPVPEYGRKKSLLKRRKAILENKEAELLELMNQVEEYIDNIGQSDLRMMFRFYYIDNMTWPMVAISMNTHFPKRRTAYTDENCRKRHDRFLEKNL